MADLLFITNLWLDSLSTADIFTLWVVGTVAGMLVFGWVTEGL